LLFGVAWHNPEPERRRIDVLVIDDWAMAQLSEPERRDLWEICEDRY
jgi:DNA replication protein DnaC